MEASPNSKCEANQACAFPVQCWSRAGSIRLTNPILWDLRQPTWASTLSVSRAACGAASAHPALSPTYSPRHSGVPCRLDGWRARGIRWPKCDRYVWTSLTYRNDKKSLKHRSARRTTLTLGQPSGNLPLKLHKLSGDSRVKSSCKIIMVSSNRMCSRVA